MERYFVVLGLKKFKQVQFHISSDIPECMDWLKTHKGAAQQRWFKTKKKYEKTERQFALQEGRNRDY